MKIIILITSVTFCGLIAGLFFSWSVSVTRGLALVSDQEYLAAMQSINREILNPFFFICFFGAAILPALSAYQYYGVSTTTFWMMVASAVIYVVGVFGVTVIGNVPLNNALDVFNIKSASAAQLASMRARFEPVWNNLNHLRACAAIVSFILSVTACVQSSKL
jgi:uncharacterized membrane protein